jgi:TolA-binding protein
MAKKSRKYYFGIFEDGPVLKIAQIINSNGHPILIDMKKTEMECSIYHDRGQNYDNQSPDLESEDVVMESLPDMNLDSEEELDSVISPHEHLLSIFPLNQGRIGLNANDEKLAVSYLDRPIRSLSKRDLIKLNLLNADEMRDKDVMWGLVQTAQDQTCILIHKGENRLFSYLQKYNQIQSERKYFYSLIDSNDISLINAVRMNYELDKEDDVLVIYLGFDYKKGILMKGEEFVKSLPILTSSDSVDLEREICSRLALYQDEMEIPHVEKVIVCGEYCQDEMLEAVANTFPSAEVSRFKFSDLLFSDELGEELPEEELAANVIPISIACKILNSKSTQIIQTNFLEKKVIKSQKIVQFSWHSFVMLAILLGISFSFTNNIMDMQNKLNVLEMQYENKKIEYEKVKSEHDPGPGIQDEIQRLMNKLNKMKSLYNNKAIWSQIMEGLTEKFSQHPVSWLTNIQGNQDGLSIFGTTTKRENIVEISSCFPDGTIKSVQSSEWENRIIWTFEIRYSYLPALPIVQSWSESEEQKVENKPVEVSDNTEKEAGNEETSKPVVTTQANKEQTRKLDPVFEDYRQISEYYYEYKHDELIIKAQEFIQKYPKNSLAVNCRYLLGEIYLRRDNLAKAEKLFDKVLTVESPMEPYALYQQAHIYQKTERPYLAIVNLNLLTRKYPASDVIPKAETLLEKLADYHE